MLAISALLLAKFDFVAAISNINKDQVTFLEESRELMGVCSSTLVVKSTRTNHNLSTVAMLVNLDHADTIMLKPQSHGRGKHTGSAQVLSWDKLNPAFISSDEFLLHPFCNGTSLQLVYLIRVSE